jgi:glycosyltransferase involved in cell wall biosynthesis
MRIAIDVSAAVHGRAGMGRYAAELSAALVSADHDDEYSLFYNGSEPVKLPPPLDRLRRLTSSLSNKPWRMSVLMAHQLRRSQDALLPGIDLFHATDHLLPRFTSVRGVFTLHDLAFQRYPETHTFWNRSFLQRMMPTFLRSADAVIAISQATKKDILAHYEVPAEKITVIPDGVSPLFVPPSTTDIASVRRAYLLPDDYILYVGTIEPRKSLTTLLDAYALLRQQGAIDDRTKLAVVGKKGWLADDFFQKLQDLGLAGQVIMPGWVPDVQLPSLYGGARVFVYPSLYEGFGLPVLEAMACGAPVVCSNTSSFPEVAGDAAMMIDPQNPAALAAAIRRILTDKNLAARLSALGQEQARPFTWAETARQTLELYRQVYARSQRAA